MGKGWTVTLAVLVVLAWGLAGAARGEDVGVLLEEGIYKEESEGDLDAAIAVYRKVIESEEAARVYSAEAYYRLGMCYLRKNEPGRATETFERLVERFPDQREFAVKARRQIGRARARLSGDEIAGIVKDAVMTISTCAETDPRVGKALDTLKGLASGAVVGELTKLLDSETDTVRRSGIFILYKGDLEAIDKAVPKLMALCSHREATTRGMAALALGTRKVSASFDTLVEMTGNDGSGYARRCAAIALGFLGDQRAVPVLEKAIEDTDELVQGNARYALGLLAGESLTPKVVSEGRAAAETAAAAPAPLEIGPAPWADGEEMRLRLKSNIGADIGMITYTARRVLGKDGRALWRVESFMAIPGANMRQFTRVDADGETFAPTAGRTKNDAGDFSAEYTAGKVVLNTTIQGNKSSRVFDTDRCVVYDNEQALYLIRRLPLEVGYETSFPIFPVQGGAVVRCRIKVLAKEEIELAGEAVETHKVELSVWAQGVMALKHTLWFTADERRLLARYDAGTAVMELDSVSVVSGKDETWPVGDGLSIMRPAGWHYYADETSGRYKVMLNMLPPELSAWAVLAADALPTGYDSTHGPARRIAEGDIVKLKSFFEAYKVRSGSWETLEINNCPAARYIADYREKGADMVEYRTYVAGESSVQWFVFRMEKEKFEAQKAQFDAIAESLAPVEEK